MSSSTIHSQIDNIKITKATSIENNSQLEVEAIAMISGEHSPCYCPITGEVLRDPDTNNLTLLEYTPELITAYASNFSTEEPINFNIDHTDNTWAGQITNLSTKEIDGKLALIAKGIVKNKDWVNKILENKFSGISIETYSNLSEPSKSKLTAISLLNSLPPACSKDKCKTKILTASSKDIISMTFDNSDLIFTDEEQEFLDDLGLNTKAAWDGSASEKKLIDFSRDKSGNIIISKIRKYFLVIEGPSGENGQYTREDLKYPVGSIVNGKPDYVLDGLIASLKRSAGQGLDLKSKIRRIIIKRFGLDMLPPSLKTKATMQFLENDNLGVDLMNAEEDKIKIEVTPPPVVEAKASETEVTKEEPKVETPPIIEAKASETEVVKEELKLEITPPVVESKASENIPVIESALKVESQKVVLSKAEMDEVAIAIGAPSFEAAKDMIEELAEIKSRLNDKAGQWQVDDLQKQIDCLRKENEDLKAFKESVEEKELMDALPRGVWEGEMEINGQMVPKIKMIAEEVRSGGVSVMLKYIKGAASGSVVRGKASEDILENGNPKEIKTKGSSEATEVEELTVDKKEREIKAVQEFSKRYINGR
jgi:hypothetical protein